MRSDYIVEVVVKDKAGRQFTPQLDRFSGTPEGVVKALTKKYCNRKTIFDWLAQPFNVADRQMREMQNRGRNNR